jgi:predicted enzyme related to lactoylglutathione lyase
MTRASTNPVVHLELQTSNLPRACAFYTRLFGWRAETVHVGPRSYLALGLGDGIWGGVVECDTERCLWLPYVEVADVAEATERARLLGASVPLAPREGPAGWRSIVAAPAGADIALWQPKA